MSARDRAAWRLIGHISALVNYQSLKDDEVRNAIGNAIDKFDGTQESGECGTP